MPRLRRDLEAAVIFPREPYRLTLSRIHSRMPALVPGALRRLPDPGTVAVTIDDGPADGDPGSLITCCAELGIQATFFLSGAMTARHPTAVRAIASAGHGIASHGWTHRSPLTLSRSALADDIRRSLDEIEAVTGRRPALYRPPYGRLRPDQHGVPAAEGCRIALWSLMPGDWYRVTAMQALSHRVARVRGGDIVVLHDRPGDRDILRGALVTLVRSCERQNLTFRLLEEAC